jgi:hypothetical protein
MFLSSPMYQKQNFREARPLYTTEVQKVCWRRYPNATRLLPIGLSLPHLYHMFNYLCYLCFGYKYENQMYVATQ